MKTTEPTKLNKQAENTYQVIRRWKVQPKRYCKGYCPTICKSQKSAEHEQERLERITGLEWTIIVIQE